jgi:hypothetical protein
MAPEQRAAQRALDSGLRLGQIGGIALAVLVPLLAGASSVLGDAGRIAHNVYYGKSAPAALAPKNPQEFCCSAAKGGCMDQGTDSLYGIGAEQLVEVTGAHLSTARRWKRLRRVPHWLQRLVSLCVFGDLGHINKAWDGWRIRGKLLISPEGWEFTFGEIRAIPFMHAQIRTYQLLQRSVQQADWIDQRYVAPADMSEAPIARQIRK